MPIDKRFAGRLFPILKDLVEVYGTPFHIYDEGAILSTYREMMAAFGSEPFRQYFAVKALPNPYILSRLVQEGSGLDCSSAVELTLAERVGALGDDVVFTSNNTSVEEYRHALKANVLVTFDDRAFFDRVDSLPEIVAFRVSPHGLAATSSLMGDSVHTKFGVPVEELAQAYAMAQRRGVTRFGIHGMFCANEMSVDRLIQAASDVIRVGAQICAATGIQMEYVNVGGGLGIPYREGELALDFRAYAEAVIAARSRWFPDYRPRIIMECGRYVTGPHGVLVTRVINRTRKGRDLIGLDASMSALMRPAFYGAYHHISLPFTTASSEVPFDVVGGLCENMDRFAIGRSLPEPSIGDIAVIHDTGAHGHSMGFTYNGRLRPAELLLTSCGSVVEIRRAETFEDHLATARLRPEPVLAAAVLDDDNRQVITNA